MTPFDRRSAHGATTNGDRPHRAAPAASREARRRRVFDGVVASYIHDISERAAPGLDGHHEPSEG